MMKEETRVRDGKDVLKRLCNIQKDKLSSDFLSSKKDDIEALMRNLCVEDAEDTDTEDDISDNDEDADELTELEPTTSKEEPHPRTSFKFKLSETPPEITKSSNTKSDNKSFQAKSKVENVTKPLDAWSLFFSKDILEIIVKYTNKNLEKNQHTTTTLQEIKAFLGILYFSGAVRDFDLTTKQMWSPVYGYNLYRCTMPQERFELLLEFLCFDDVDTRSERTLKHKLAPIKDIWDIFIANCTKYYSPSKHCTIGRTYLEFAGDFEERVLIPKTEDKYGIQITCLNDAETLYMINAEPYVGPVKTTESENEQSYYIRKLSEPLHKTERNIICDDWFTSVEIMEKMKKEYSLTMVGALSKKKVKDLPSFIMNTTSTCKPHFGYSNDYVLVSYSPNGCKVALLLSNFYKFKELNEANQLSVISVYGWTKKCTKNFDMVCRIYSTAQETKSWPLRLFFGMLDQAGINSSLLYNLRKKNKAFDHRTFLRELAFALIKPYLEVRLKKKDTSDRYIRIAINQILAIKKTYEKKPSYKKLSKSARCYLYLKGDRQEYSLICCAECDQPVCEDHHIFVCMRCD